MKASGKFYVGDNVWRKGENKTFNSSLNATQVPAQSSFLCLEDITVFEQVSYETLY